jgi:hypothetical protein
VPTSENGRAGDSVVGPWSETWKKQRTVGPGSWLPFPASFEPRDAPPEQVLDHVPEQPPAQTAQGTQQVNEDGDADRQYIERIRTIHSFGDAEDVHNAPEGLFQPSKKRETPIEHSLVQQLLHTHEADVLLDSYRQMSASFPFVIVAPSVTAQELYQEKPMLLLAMIMAASSQDHQRQMSLDTIFRKELAERTIITPRRTLGLVQSVLVYLSWYVTHLDANAHSSRQQVSFCLQSQNSTDILLTSSCYRAGPRHRSSPRLPAITLSSPTEACTAKSRGSARARASVPWVLLSFFDACARRPSYSHVLTLGRIGAGLQKPNLLKHTSYMTEWAQNLRNEREYDSDETISHLITLRQLDDQVQDTLYSDNAINLPLSDARTLMHVRFLESQLDAWKRDSQAAGAQRCKSSHCMYVENVMLIKMQYLPSPHPSRICYYTA